MKLKAALTACMLAAGLLLAGPVLAWEPTKPITLIVGFSAGGGTDVIARALAAGAKDTIPVPVVVVNKPGASGVIAAEQVAKSAPDGYTLLIAGGSESTSLPNHKEVPYNLATSFRPIVHAIRLRMMIVTRTDSHIKTFKDLVAEAKANPGKLAYGTSGQGSLTHSMMLVVNKTVGIDTLHVPYKGDADVVRALVAGEIQIGTGSPDQFKPWIDSGKVIPLTLSSLDRFPGYPEVPTLKELGYDIYLENMKGIVAPAGLPDEIYEYLRDRFKKAMETDVFKQMIAKANYEVQYMDGPTFAKNMQGMSNAIAGALKK